MYQAIGQIIVVFINTLSERASQNASQVNTYKQIDKLHTNK